MIRKIKNVREERRKIKCDMEILRVFNQHINKIIQKENRKLLLAEVNKANKKMCGNYKNRVYTNEELENIIKGAK